MVKRRSDPLCSPFFIPLAGFKPGGIRSTAVAVICLYRYPPVITGTGSKSNLRVISNAGNIFPHSRIREDLLKIRISGNLNPGTGLFFAGRADDPGEGQQVGRKPKRIFNMIDTHFGNLHIVIPF